MLEVKKAPGRGRGAFAARSIRAGEVLIRALPYAVVPNDASALTHCTICLRPAAEKLYSAAHKCTACGSAAVCARCRADPGARLIHADECAALARLAAAPAAEKPKDTRSLRLLMRLLLARWREQSGEAQYVSEEGDWWGAGDVAADEFEDVMSLTSPLDADELPDGPLPEGSAEGGANGGDVSLALPDALLDMAKQARYFLGPHTRVGHELGAGLMGRLCSNSLTLYGEDGGEVGAALSAGVAMLNHNCEPNADWAVDGDGCLVVTALSPVAKGGEVLLSYVDPRLPAAVRRRKLKENFFFDCDCAACAAGEVAPRWRAAAEKRKR